MVYMVVSALLFILVTFFLKKNNLIPVLYNSRKNLNLPPVVKSWPLVGPLYMLAKDPVNLIKKNYQKHGSVFTIKVLGRSVTLLIGPEVSRHFYTALDSEISQEELYKFSIPMFGPNVFFGAPMEIRQQQYLFLLQGLRPLMLRSYVNQIVSESQDYFSRWKYCGTVDLVQELDHLTTLTTARCLLGREVRANLNEEVSALIHNIAGGAHPIGMFFPYLPLPSHIRRDRARNKLNRIFKNIINSRKTSPQLEVDLLQTLLESRYKNGESNTNEQIIGILVVALFAGKFTTANTAIWTGAYLLQHKTYFSKALDEQVALLGRHGQERDFDILTKMDVLHRCIKEAARIGSPPVITPRYCHKNFTVTTKEGREYTIPKGHIVATSPAVANHADHIFKDPDRYNPDRYLYAEGNEMASQPFSYITFGGGRHACPGEAFAYIQLKIIWSYLIRNFELDLTSPFAEAEWNGTDKILVHYKRRQLSI